MNSDENNPDRDLYDEALEILAQSDMLKRTVIWQDEQVDRLVSKYTDEELDELSEGEKLEHLKEVEEVYGRLNESVRALEKLDKQYTVLREKFKKLYGKEYLPPISGDIRKDIGPDDEIDLLGGGEDTENGK